MEFNAAVFCLNLDVCCERLHELTGKCVNVQHTLCHDLDSCLLDSCLLDSDSGLLVLRSIELLLYINRWSSKQCVLFQCNKK